MTASAARILGLDPGTAVTGFAVIEAAGNKRSALDQGCVRTRASESLSKRLAFLVAEVEGVIERWRPDAIALEQAFFGRNAQSMMRLGEARGALLALAGRRGIEVYEYPTATVKKALTGSGRAEKTQVQFMVTRLLNLKTPPMPLDASDALALALTLSLDRASAVQGVPGRYRRS